MRGYYKCECGKEFDNPQKFNGHKRHCVIHLENTHKLEKMKKSEEFLKLQSYKALKEKSLENKKIKEELKLKELIKWISEKHTCEKCGKIMTEKFGSGRFCSRNCANSRSHSVEIKNKISNSVKETYNTNEATKQKLYDLNRSRKEKYYNNPKRCHICGNIISYDKRRHAICSEECLKIFYKENAKKNNLGGLQNITSWGKRGSYKGIHCDSRYELAFLIYCKDNNILIERANTAFEYSFEGVNYKYYPDFYLSETDTYIELKGYDPNNSRTLSKLNAVLNEKHNVKILYEKDLIPYFEYIENTYNIPYNKLEILYDK